MSNMYHALKVFSASELYQATGGFHKICLIGEGGFGKVYHAMVNLTPVAIKVLDHEGLQGMREFHNEMRLLASIRHPHVVQLLGYAAEGQTQCLVYELMARGSLEDILVGKGSQRESLTWTMRIRIAAQIGHALAHLHAKGITHRDVKPANIFLDCDFNAKLGDIGLASQDSGMGRAEEAVGTWSYLAPEYKHNGRSSSKTDTYAFGLSMLQLLTAASQTQELVHRCQTALEACNLHQVLDKRAGEWDLLAAERLVKLSLWCAMHDAEQRPSMAMIFTDLQRILRQLQQLGLEPL
jgi:serine/threonine protein kinase